MTSSAPAAGKTASVILIRPPPPPLKQGGRDACVSIMEAWRLDDAEVGGDGEDWMCVPRAVVGLAWMRRK